MRRPLGFAPARTFVSLRHRNFRLFFVGQLISQVGTWLTSVALILLVLRLTDSGFAIGALAAAQFGPVLVLGAWGGLVADRSDKRTLLIVTQVLQMIQSFALAALAFMAQPPLAAFYAVALAGGCILAFDNPVRRSFVSEMVSADEVQNAVTLNSALMTSSRIFGPALAGLLVISVGYGWCFTIDAISYLAVIVGLWRMRPSELRRPARTGRAKAQVRAGLRYARSIPELRIPLVMVALVGALTFNFPVVVPLFVTRTLGGSETSYTMLYSVLSIGSLAGALVAARRTTNDVRHVASTAFAFGIAVLFLAAAPDLGTAFVVVLAVGFTSVAFISAATAIVQIRCDPAMRGRVLALQAVVMIGTTPLGGPIVGAICDRFGARVGLVVGGLAAMGAAGWGCVAGADRRRPSTLRTPPEIRGGGLMTRWPDQGTASDLCVLSWEPRRDFIGVDRRPRTSGSTSLPRWRRWLRARPDRLPGRAD